MTGMTSSWRWHSPAGERVSLSAFCVPRHSEDDARQAWVGFESGTAALASALVFGKQQLRGNERVALPAYSCPSIVAAALFAGLEPVFLDCESNSLSPGSARYQQAIAEGCSILVLVDLFGAPAPVEDLCTPSLPSSTWLVHDRAQSFCAPGIELTSMVNAVVTSFGRGKPIQLLGGGAVACREHDEFRRFAEAHYPVHHWSRTYGLSKAVLYNLALSPLAYNVIVRLPGLALGETRLVLLSHIARLPAGLIRAATGQARMSAADNERRVERCLALSRIAAAAGYQEPCRMPTGSRLCALNRFPLLCETEAHADSLFNRGRRLGVSRMYRRTLPEFLGRPASAAAREFPNAFDLSRRLVTLPTHSRLRESELASLRSILDACRQQI